MILLLTGCINPNGMSYTALSNTEERKAQYIEAINYYLSNTSYPIVFVENSGTDISNLFTNAIKSNRMEYLFFSGNNNKERGKGYGECEILQYALNHSVLINSAKEQRIAKITGRLIIKNIKRIIWWHTLFSLQRTIFFAINSDLTFPDSRLIIASKEFYSVFLKSKDSIDDSAGYYFEHALGDTIKKEKSFSFSPFYIMPQIEGVSGSSGKLYNEGKSSFRSVIQYARYAFYLHRQFSQKYR